MLFAGLMQSIFSQKKTAASDELSQKELTRMLEDFLDLLS